MTDRLDVLAQREKLTHALRLESIADPGRKRIVDATFPLPPEEPQSITGPTGIKWVVLSEGVLSRGWVCLDRHEPNSIEGLGIPATDRAHVGALLIPGGIPGVVRAFVESIVPTVERGGTLFAGGRYYRWDTLHNAAIQHLDSILSRLSQKAGEP